MAAGDVPDHYGTYYRAADEDVYADVRREAFGEDLGQNSWVTRAQLDRAAGWLGLAPGVGLLDVACGAGGPSVYLARSTGCSVTGVDYSDAAVDGARRRATVEGVADRARFVQGDATRPLAFQDEGFGAIVCIDAINHLGDRGAVLEGFAALLAPGCRLVYTDPIVVTGPLSSDEVAIRAAAGRQILMPPGANEALLARAGLAVVEVKDLTAELATIAGARRDARASRAAALRAIEGDGSFDGLQRFFDLVARLARERRLSRVAYVAERA